MHFFNKKRLIFFATIIVLAFFFWLSFRFQVFLSNILVISDNFIDVHPLLSIVVFFLLAVISTLFSFFSSVFLVPLAINSWGNMLTFLLLIGGWFTGGVIAYFIGKYLGRKIILYFTSPEKVRHYENLISSKMKFSLVLLLRMATPDEIPSYLLGILRYDFLKYSLATFLVQIPVALGAVYASRFFIDRQIFFFLGFFALLIVVFRIVYFYFKKYFPRFHED